MNDSRRAMRTIDAHQHFWWLGKRLYRWPDTAQAALSRDFTPDDLAAERTPAGVEGSVLIQSLNDLDETREFLELASHHDDILGVVGWAPLEEPRRAASVLDELLARPGRLVGIRHLINFEPDPDWLLRPNVQECIGEIAARRLVFDTVPNDPRRFDAVLSTAAQHPSMTVVIDHLGRPPVVTGAWHPWADFIRRAADLPNVSIKLSVGLDVVLDWTWSTEALRRYADHVLQCFGPDRVMAASNWPVSTLAGSYSRVWSGVRDLTAHLDAASQAAVLAGTVERVFQLAPQGARHRELREMS